MTQALLTVSNMVAFSFCLFNLLVFDFHLAVYRRDSFSTYLKNVTCFLAYAVLNASKLLFFVVPFFFPQNFFVLLNVVSKGEERKPKKLRVRQGHKKCQKEPRLLWCWVLWRRIQNSGNSSQEFCYQNNLFCCIAIEEVFKLALKGLCNIPKG